MIGNLLLIKKKKGKANSNTFVILEPPFTSSVRRTDHLCASCPPTGNLREWHLPKAQLAKVRGTTACLHGSSLAASRPHDPTRQRVFLECPAPRGGLGAEGSLLFAEAVLPGGSVAAAPRGYTPCWQFTSRGLHASWLTNNQQRGEQEFRQPPQPPPSPRRAARLHAARTRRELAFQTGANRTASLGRARLAQLKGPASSGCSHCSPVCRAARTVWAAEPASIHGLYLEHFVLRQGDRADSQLAVRGQCFSCSTQVGSKFWFCFVPAAERFGKRCRGTRRGSRTPLPHQSLAFLSPPAPQRWKLERRRWFVFLASVQDFRAYFRAAVGISAPQPLRLGSSHLLLCVEGRIARPCHATLPISRGYQGARCSCLWTKFSECVDSTLVPKRRLF